MFGRSSTISTATTLTANSLSKTTWKRSTSSSLYQPMKRSIPQNLFSKSNSSIYSQSKKMKVKKSKMRMSSRSQGG